MGWSTNFEMKKSLPVGETMGILDPGLDCGRIPLNSRGNLLWLEAISLNSVLEAGTVKNSS